MRRIPGVVALVTLAIGVVGCSGPLTVDEYVERMASAADAYAVEAGGLSIDYQANVEDGVRALIDDPDAADVDAEAVALVTASTLNYLTLLGDAMDRYARAMGEVAPPEGVAVEHDAYIGAVEGALAAMPATRSSVEAAESLDGIGVAISSSGFADGLIRWTITCSALEQAVRDQGRGIDLVCDHGQQVDG